MENGKDKPEDGFRIVEKSMIIHLAEDRATTFRNCAIKLLQEQEDGLTTDQKIAMILCFMEDVVAANTYVLLTDPEVRQGSLSCLRSGQCNCINCFCSILDYISFV